MNQLITVQDRNDNPLEGARVVLFFDGSEVATYFTDENGEATITVTENQNYVIYISYSPYPDKVIPYQAVPQTVTIELSPCYELEFDYNPTNFYRFTPVRYCAATISRQINICSELPNNDYLCRGVLPPVSPIDTVYKMPVINGDTVNILVDRELLTYTDLSISDIAVGIARNIDGRIVAYNVGTITDNGGDQLEVSISVDCLPEYCEYRFVFYDTREGAIPENPNDVEIIFYQINPTNAVACDGQIIVSPNINTAYYYVSIDGFTWIKTSSLDPTVFDGLCNGEYTIYVFDETCNFRTQEVALFYDIDCSDLSGKTFEEMQGLRFIQLQGCIFDDFQ